MPIIHHEGGLVFCRLSVTVAELPALLRGHRQCDPETAIIEAEATRLIAGNFQDVALSSFIKSVCRWGGYSGVAGRVLKHNGLAEALTTAFRETHQSLAENRPTEALKRITKLHSLGISFGSKHLKFLAPDRAIVLDSVISRRLGYALDPGGYAEFLGDCHVILQEVLAAQVPFPFPDEGNWRVSDIEMAIFQKLRP